MVDGEGKAAQRQRGQQQAAQRGAWPSEAVVLPAPYSVRTRSDYAASGGRIRRIQREYARATDATIGRAAMFSEAHRRRPQASDEEMDPRREQPPREQPAAKQPGQRLAWSVGRSQARISGENTQRLRAITGSYPSSVKTMRTAVLALRGPPIVHRGLRVGHHG
jgi:hypothetical protein